MHSNFEGMKTPKDEYTKIWRYMDFEKFIWMIEEKALFFSNFKNFDDPLEGHFPFDNVLQICNVIRQVNKSISEEEALNIAKKQVRQVQETIYGAGDYFINCWHMNNGESVAMWNLYSDLKLGIAIQSTYKNLSNCLFKHEEHENIEIGIVKYTRKIDWKHELPIYRPFIHKRKSFSYEREIRAILFRPHDTGKSKPETGNKESKDNITKGVSVSVDLNELINSIYISPKSHQYFEKVIRILLEKHGIHHKEVIRSTLYDVNLY